MCYNEGSESFLKGRSPRRNFSVISRGKEKIVSNLRIMKKGELIDAVYEAAGLDTKKQADDVVNAVFDIITKTLVKGEEVGVTGFGTFKSSKRAARMGVNPQTGEKIQIAATTVPKFSAGKGLKEAVKK